MKAEREGGGLSWGPEHVAWVAPGSTSTLDCPWMWPFVATSLILPLAGSSWKQELLGNQK